MRSSFLPVLIGVVWLSLCPGPCAAEEAGTSEAAPAFRESVPAPHPAKGWVFEGDVLIDDLWVGTLTVRLGVKRLPAGLRWQVSEELYVDLEGVETKQTLRYLMAGDLSLLNGRCRVERGEEAVTTVLMRAGDSIHVTRRHEKPGTDADNKMFAIKTPKEAAGGWAPLLHLARHVKPEPGATWRFPRLRLDRLAGLASIPAEPEGKRVLMLRTSPKSRVPGAAWQLTGAGPKDKLAIHMNEDRTQIVRIEHPTMTVVPKGKGADEGKSPDPKPAKTWKEAFLKFGYGYHMAKPDMLEHAFHWPSMYEHETQVTKTWKGGPLEAFKKAWIGEFMAQSLKRSEKEARKLLRMTLASGNAERDGDDTIVFRAHRNFGGGVERTYTLKRIDGVWFITWIKF